MLEDSCLPVKFAKFLRIPLFYGTPAVAASAFIRSTKLCL